MAGGCAFGGPPTAGPPHRQALQALDQPLLAGLGIPPILDRMKILAQLTALLVATSPIALAQSSVEGFDGGANPDQWEAWFSVYNSVPTTGGNPGGYLQLDNFTSGPANCHYVDIFPDGDAGSVAYAHTGDWRASAVDQVSIDLDIMQGIYSGDVIVEIISDPGTPQSTADDCVVSFTLTAAGSNTGGWNTYTFLVPSTQTTLPAGWVTDGPCSGDAAWNQVMTDVDQMRFSYDGSPGSFCNFTNWILGIDNITVGGMTAPPLGMNYCSANANSTGQAAMMAPTGSASVMANNLTLECTGLPTNQFGIFVASRTTGFVPNPGGSSGNLCLGGVIGRLSLPMEIVNSGSLGQFSLPVDLNFIPEGPGRVSILPGDTWSFSCWFRDVQNGVGTSNFGDGYTINFL